MEEYEKCGENWLKSEIVVESNRRKRVDSTRRQTYVACKDIREKHGAEAADAFMQEKKRLQLASGDYGEGLPHWFQHPDFPDREALQLNS